MSGSGSNLLRVLVVDDEPIIRQGIRDLLSEMPEIEIAGECGTGAQAIEAITSAAPNLVLLDVQMPDCSGLDVVRRIGFDRMPLVIFVTAYDEYAVAAFEMNAVDYLLKPFHRDRLWRSIDRARDALVQRNQVSLALRLEALLLTADRTLPTRLVVREGSRYEFVPVDSVDWVASANNYVELHCGARVLILGETLTGIERKLDSRKFVRVHRCHIVNVSRIAAVHADFGGTFELEMRNGVRLATGRQFRTAVQSLIAR